MDGGEDPLRAPQRTVAGSLNTCYHRFVALLTYPTGTTFAPGTFDWWRRKNYEGYIRNVASYMVARHRTRPEFTCTEPDLRSIGEGMLRPRLSAAYASFIENISAYHSILKVPVVELQRMEYPWRWTDATRGRAPEDPELRLAFEALLDVGYYIEAYQLVAPVRPRRGC